jgi:hypothetical protein
VATTYLLILALRVRWYIPVGYESNFPDESTNIVASSHIIVLSSVIQPLCREELSQKGFVLFCLRLLERTRKPSFASGPDLFLDIVLRQPA